MRLAVVGSGAGTTARAIIESSIKDSTAYEVVLVVATSPSAGLCEVGKGLGVPVVVLVGDEWEIQLISTLKEYNVQLVVLAGFMKLLPATVIKSMDGAVVNTHPALLPLHGGKGMYGRRVHQAVADAQETISGVSLHWVNEEYDRGAIIEQVQVGLPVRAGVEEIESIVREKERNWLPGALKRLVTRGMP